MQTSAFWATVAFWKQREDSAMILASTHEMISIKKVNLYV
jgi:hypothetical protein